MAKDRNVKIQRVKQAGFAGHIVRVVFFTLFTLAATWCVIAVCCMGLLNQKWSDATTDVNHISASVSDLEYMDESARTQVVNNYFALNSHIQGITVMDSDGNVKQSYGEDAELPEGKLALTEYPQLQDILGNTNAYIAEENMVMLGVNSFSPSNIKVLIKQLAEAMSEQKATTREWLDQELSVMDVWFEFPYGDTADILCIKYRMSLLFGDMAYILVAIAIVLLITFIVLIYHVISIVRLILTRRAMYNLVYMDEITNGKNKLYYEDYGKRLLKRYFRRANSALGDNVEGRAGYASVCVSFTRFRSYVAYNGVKKGNELVEKFYKIIAPKMDRRELAVRYEKADFALLVSYSSPEELNERIGGIIQELALCEEGERLGFAAGVCHVATEKDDLVSVYNDATVARAMALEQGENTIVWFTDEMRASQLWERRVENEMEDALSRGEFQMYLQPKYITKDETLGGAEALCRWKHPTEGLVPPYKFIPIFEENGFIVKLDDFMIGEVAKYQAKWIAEGRKVVPISVNVSRAHFAMDNLAEHIRDIVDKYGAPHDCVELELTESAFFDDKEQLLRTVSKMQEYGFAVSMDDFGAGYSSLNSLKELPLDVIKLDAEFFRGKDSEDRGKLIVEDAIALARKLGMSVVAEGIETREQVDFLAGIDNDILIQGYYFAKPMPVEEYEEKAFTKVVTINAPIQ